MVDCSRDGVYTLQSLKKLIDILQKMGYNMLQIYTEDTYTLDDEPYFGYFRGRYTDEELKELDAYAKEHGMELVPCIQTLAHLGGITRWQAYNEITDINDILLAGEEKTYEIIEKMFAKWARCVKSRRIHIGMDEAHMVGLGKYYDKHGVRNRFDILLDHLNRVCGIAKKFGFTPMMWSDMFFVLANHGKYRSLDPVIPEELIRKVPANLELVYWDYYRIDKQVYDAMFRAHKKFPNKIIFAGGAWSWKGFAPHNEFSVRSSKVAIESMLEVGVDEIIVTGWKDDGAESSLFSTLPALMAIAEFTRGNFDIEKIKEQFKKVVGMDYDAFCSLDLPNISLDGYPKNPSKYMLYSDPFLGIFDKTADINNTEKFNSAKKILEQNCGNAEFGYVFRTLADLCYVLEIKYALGMRIRAAYAARDRNALQACVGDCDELIVRLKQFYASFRDQWSRECLLYGFEKHDVRIGGLIWRIQDCKNILQDYLDGKMSSIRMLEESVLPYTPDSISGESITHNDWLTEAFIKPKM